MYKFTSREKQCIVPDVVPKRPPVPDDVAVEAPNVLPEADAPNVLPNKPPVDAADVPSDVPKINAEAT